MQASEETFFEGHLLVECGSPMTVPEGLSIIRKASEEGSILARAYLMTRDQEKEKIKKGIEELEKIANEDMSNLTPVRSKLKFRAMAILGVIFSKGLGVEKDEPRAFQLFVKAAQAGDLSAKSNIGDSGPGMNNILPELIKWLTESGAQGYYLSWCHLGNIHWMALNNPEEGRKLFIKAAQKGVPEAYHNIGVMEYNNRNYGEALKYYRNAAQLGLKQAQNAVGALYRDGEGVPKNLKEAEKWFRLSAEAGWTPGMRNLASVLQNKEEAELWTRKAVLNKDPMSAFNLSQILIRKSGKIDPNGRIISGEDPQNDPVWIEVTQLIKLAAEGGVIKAIYNYGVSNQYGRGIPKNPQEAVRWYRLGANSGDPDSLNNLGQCLLEGIGTQKDVPAAFTAFQRSAASGHVLGTYNLATCYEHGLGVNCDKQKSIQLHLRNQNFPLSVQALYRLTETVFLPVHNDSLPHGYVIKFGKDVEITEKELMGGTK